MTKDDMLARLRAGEAPEDLADEYCKMLTMAQHEYEAEQKALAQAKTADKKKAAAANAVADAINALVECYTDSFEPLDGSAVLEVSEAFLKKDVFNALIQAFLQ